jgi:hypothetical protein
VDSERQPGLLDGLVKGALGRIPELEQYVGLLTKALMMLVISGHPDLISFAKKSLEEEYVNDENVQAWLRAVDNETLPKGVEFKKTWHYALMLGTILYAIGSTAAQRTTAFLRERAASPQLSAQLASMCPKSENLARGDLL